MNMSDKFELDKITDKDAHLFEDIQNKLSYLENRTSVNDQLRRKRERHLLITLIIIVIFVIISLVISFVYLSDALNRNEDLKIEIEKIKTKSLMLKKETFGLQSRCKCLAGQKGQIGDKGQPGNIGPTGKDGNKGLAGEKGFRGEKGERGVNGLRGDHGQKGEMGSRGIRGPPGNIGLKGKVGDIGRKGPAGDPGLKGENGIKGDKGQVGNRGVIGPPGKAGEKGQVGDKGDKGTVGDRGPVGRPGVKGQKGKQGTRGREGCPREGSTDVCNERWAYYGCSCYLLETNQKRNWHDALSICKGKGATLVKIEDAKENEFIISLSKRNKAERTNIFIGLRDTSNDIKKRNFIWTDGSSLGYQYWNKGEPNNHRGTHEDCAVTRGKSKWNDIPCSNKAGYICEQKL